MIVSRSTFILVILAICVLFAFSGVAEAAYRKPPFNGSIFGKRSGNSIGTSESENFQNLNPWIDFFFVSFSPSPSFDLDYDSSGKTLSAMCEIAVEACQTWFPQDKKWDERRFPLEQLMNNLPRAGHDYIPNTILHKMQNIKSQMPQTKL